MVAAVLAAVLMAAPVAKTGAVQVAVSQLAWLAESGWRASQGGEVVEEQWLAPAGATMLGVSRTVKDGRTVGEEYLRLEERAGQVVLTLVLGLGRPPRSFIAVRAGPAEVEFQSIDDPNGATLLYRRTATGLFVKVSGRRAGAPFVLEFNFVPAQLQGVRPAPTQASNPEAPARDATTK